VLREFRASALKRFPGKSSKIDTDAVVLVQYTRNEARDLVDRNNAAHFASRYSPSRYAAGTTTNRSRGID